MRNYLTSFVASAISGAIDTAISIGGVVLALWIFGVLDDVVYFLASLANYINACYPQRLAAL